MRFLALDSLRGACALVIALMHFEAAYTFKGVPFLQHSYLFADFFFVLSGFVITHAYQDSIRGPGGMAAFVVRRFGRVWPLHAAILTFLVLAEASRSLLPLFGHHLARPLFGGPMESFWSIASSVLMLHSLNVEPYSPWNTPSWSISAEFWAYVAFGAACLIQGRRTLALAATAACASAAAIAMFSADGMNSTSHFGFVRCLYGFSVGHLAYRLYAAAPALRAAISSALWAEPACALAVAAFVWSASPGPLALAAPVAFAFPVVVFGVGSGRVSRALLARPMQILGMLSYSIYMVHWPLIEAISKLSEAVAVKTGLHLWVSPEPGEGIYDLMTFGPQWATDAVVLAYLAAVVVLASVTYRFVEQPGRRLCAGFADRLEVGSALRRQRRMDTGASVP